MATIKEAPRTFTINNLVWTEDEVQALKDLYSGRSEIVMEKRAIRSHALLQKALNSEAIVASSSPQPLAEEASLKLAQLAYDLIEML